MSKDKVLVTCALTGVLANREQCPYLPYTPAEIGEEARRAYEAGAAQVHIHGRDPETGAQTWSAEVYRQIKEEVQKRSPVIVNFSTGGFNYGCDTDEQKRAHLEHVWRVRPEVAALNMGSMNYAKYSEKRKQFVFDMVFINWRGVLAPPGISKERQRQYVAYFEKMHDTDDWQRVLKKNGWTDDFKTGDEFGAFLRNQDKRVSTTLKELRLL
jgi:tRNA-dihydrouridine synthase